MQFCVYSLLNTTCQKNLNSFCGFKCVKTIAFTSYCSFAFIHFEKQLAKRTLTLSAVSYAWNDCFHFLLQFCVYSLRNATCQKNFHSFCGFKRMKTIVFTSNCSFVFIQFEIQLDKRTLTLSAVLNAFEGSIFTFYSSLVFIHF